MTKRERLEKLLPKKFDHERIYREEAIRNDAIDECLNALEKNSEIYYSQQPNPNGCLINTSTVKGHYDTRSMIILDIQPIEKEPIDYKQKYEELKREHDRLRNQLKDFFGSN